MEVVKISDGKGGGVGHRQLPDRQMDYVEHQKEMDPKAFAPAVDNTE
jgi:hypothetical protein